VSWTLPRDVLCLELVNGGRNISRSLKLLCFERNIDNLRAIQERSGCLVRQRGNKQFVCKPEVIVAPQCVHDQIVSLQGSVQMAERGGFDFRNGGKCFRMSATPTVGV